MTTTTEAAIAKVRQRRKPGPPPGAKAARLAAEAARAAESVPETDIDEAPARNADRNAAHHADSAEHHSARSPAREKPRVRTRQSTLNYSAMDDEFFVDLTKVPADISVEWKRLSNVGEENPFYIAKMRTQGWEPVDPREHPDWVPVPPGYDKPHVIKSGLILMERPKSLTDEARREDRINAAQRMREAEQRLGKAPKGTAPRDADPSIMPRVTKEFGRMIQVEAEE